MEENTELLKAHRLKTRGHKGEVAACLKVHRGHRPTPERTNT